MTEEEDERDRIKERFGEMMESSKDGGVERVEGSSEDIAVSDSYRTLRLLRAIAW